MDEPITSTSNALMMDMEETFCGSIKEVTEAEAKTIFNQYNREADRVRCPYGRSGVRAQLDAYALAAVNLYGAVRLEDLVTIFNGQNEAQTDPGELYVLLLPLVLKKGHYAFYKDHLVHPVFFDDFESADYLIRDQAGKPLYIPDQEELLDYRDIYLFDNIHWKEVLLFLLDTYGDTVEVLIAFIEIRDYLMFDDGFDELGSIMEKHGLLFERGQMEHFFDLLMQAINNTRIWENKGYTPAEMHALMESGPDKAADLPRFQKAVKIGRNSPCPCGSGKKYKHCCARYEISGSAQISEEESFVFYETWLGLLNYVDRQEQVTKRGFDPDNPDQKLAYQVRQVLWENPSLIDDYIRNIALPQEEIDLLRSWGMKFRKDKFLIVGYQDEYAVFLGTGREGENRLYGIKGISEPVSSVLRLPLPVLVEAVLLPFKDKLIYDSLLKPMPISFGDGARAMFEEMHQKAKEFPVITQPEQLT